MAFRTHTRGVVRVRNAHAVGAVGAAGRGDGGGGGRRRAARPARPGAAAAGARGSGVCPARSLARAQRRLPTLGGGVHRSRIVDRPVATTPPADGGGGVAGGADRRRRRTRPDVRDRPARLADRQRVGGARRRTADDVGFDRRPRRRSVAGSCAAAALAHSTGAELGGGRGDAVRGPADRARRPARRSGPRGGRMRPSCGALALLVGLSREDLDRDRPETESAMAGDLGGDRCADPRHRRRVGNARSGVRVGACGRAGRDAVGARLAQRSHRRRTCVVASTRRAARPPRPPPRRSGGDQAWLGCGGRCVALHRGVLSTRGVRSRAPPGRRCPHGPKGGGRARRRGGGARHRCRSAVAGPGGLRRLRSTP